MGRGRKAFFDFTFHLILVCALGFGLATYGLGSVHFLHSLDDCHIFFFPDSVNKLYPSFFIHSR